MSDQTITINTDNALYVPKETKPQILPVYGDSNPLLSQVMPEYTDPLPNPIMSNLVSRLKVTMKAFAGIGLSANQCGIPARVFVIGTEHFQMACINPKVISGSGTQLKGVEGCLSFPGMYLNITRPNFIDVEFTDENGETKRMTLDGLTARCFLHELDHMNGIKYTSYVGPVALQTAKRKQQKLLKKHMRNRK
jgi:peptide deformylase